MTVTAGLAILVILGLGVALGLLLVAMVGREGPTESGLDWASAERVARRDEEESDDREW